MKIKSISKAKKMGRPTKQESEKRTYTYAVRLTPDENNTFMKAVMEKQKTPSELIRYCCLPSLRKRKAG